MLCNEYRWNNNIQNLIHSIKYDILYKLFEKFDCQLTKQANYQGYFYNGQSEISKSESIINIINQNIYETLYLIPYPPFLNPIENMFRKWNNMIKEQNLSMKCLL
ncbi:hypothetical protein COBT_002739 [Conglomerata obtusa]